MSEKPVMQDSWDVFYGRVTDRLARVYVRGPRASSTSSPTITGYVRGPFCRHSHTLPATIPLHDLGDGPTWLAEAAVPDPCGWSPDLPAWYEVHADIQHNGVTQHTIDRSLGIRRLGTAGRNLRYDGRRWVARGWEPGPEETPDATAWRAARLVMLAVEPSDEICREAAHEGVLIVARLVNEPVAQLQRLAQWASVGIAILPANTVAPSTQLRNAAPNVLLAAWLTADASGPAASAYDDLDLMFCEVQDPDRFNAWAQSCPLPVAAVGRAAHDTTISNARRHCEHLQRDLAPGGDYAGYFIRHET